MCRAETITAAQVTALNSAHHFYFQGDVVPLHWYDISKPVSRGHRDSLVLFLPHNKHSILIAKCCFWRIKGTCGLSIKYLNKPLFSVSPAVYTFLYTSPPTYCLFTAMHMWYSPATVGLNETTIFLWPTILSLHGSVTMGTGCTVDWHTTSHWNVSVSFTS